MVEPNKRLKLFGLEVNFKKYTDQEFFKKELVLTDLPDLHYKKKAGFATEKSVANPVFFVANGLRDGKSVATCPPQIAVAT